MTRRPPRLQPGMTLGIVAPSGPLGGNDDLDADIAALQALGLRVVLGAHVRDQRGYLAGQDQDRADDLVAMLERTDVDAIMCLGGGYGAHRTVRALDIERLRQLRPQPPKVFTGYSDITVLHAVLQRELGWTTFYGPMVRGWARRDHATRAIWRRVVMEGEAPTITPVVDGTAITTIATGRATGPVLGGCLSLISTLVGTPWQIDFRGAIMLVEDINEQPYRIDRMLTHLALSGAFDGCAGIVVGEHVGCEADDAEGSLSLLDVLHDCFAPLGMPVVYGLPVGHGAQLHTVPLGARAELDADAGTLRFLEPGVEIR
jgi:muramoyltetrapeptide carboxypeptidase